MISFSAELQKYGEQGEKTAWTYVLVPEDLAQQLKPGNKKAFRIRGKIDHHSFEGGSIMPVGGGDFIFAVNGTVRKKIGKEKGAHVFLEIEEDPNPYVLSADLLECLEDEPEAKAYFDGLAPSHQRYFSKWIEDAKTHETKAKRIMLSLNAMNQKWDYGKMIRASQGKPD